MDLPLKEKSVNWGIVWIEKQTKRRLVIQNLCFVCFYFVLGNCDAIVLVQNNAPRGCADRGIVVNCCVLKVLR